MTYIHCAINININIIIIIIIIIIIKEISFLTTYFYVLLI